MPTGDASVDSGLHNPNLLYTGSHLLEGPKV